jgi:hypothetical protein
MQVRFRVRSNYSATRGEASVGHSNMHRPVGAQVLKPLRTLIFGDNVESPVGMSKPYLDLASLTGFPPARREIKVLFAIDFTGL